MYFVKKSGKWFNEGQSLTNHLRKIYENSEIAYLTENEITEIPKCEFCINSASFISFLRGYRNRCNSKECKILNLNKSITNVSKRLLLNKQNILEGEIQLAKSFIIEHLDYYKNNHLDTNIFDPLTEKNTNRLTLRGHIRKRYPKAVFIETRICKFCDCKFDLDILSEDYNHKFYCNKKSCYNLDRHDYNTNKLVFDNSKDLNNYVYNNNLNPYDVKSNAKNFKIWNGIYKIINYDKLFKCPLTGWLVPLTSKTSVLNQFIKKLGFDRNEYFRKYLPELVISCKNCSKEHISGKSGIQTKQNLKGFGFFCSHRCFNEFRKNNPQLYPISLSSRQKRSEKMKDKIANGEFTPFITKTWTHWSAKIELPDGTIKKFRSSWEACVWNCHQHLEYEKIRIPYLKDGKNHNYIADFFDETANKILEIKPVSEWNSQNDKMQQVINFCLKNKIKFEWINENNIMQYIDETKFDDQNKEQLNKLKSGIKKN